MANFFINFFIYVFYQPLLNGLVFLYKLLGFNLGLAIITLTLIIRIILLPISIKALRYERSLLNLRDKIKEIQTKYKNNKEEQARKILELYQKEKVNPFFPLLINLIQLPILWGLYEVFRKGLTPDSFFYLYPSISPPLEIHSSFLGVFDLSKPSPFLAVFAGIVHYLQSLFFSKTFSKQHPPTTSKKELDFSTIFQKQLLYFLPLLIAIILFSLPSALALYWTINSFFSIIQQYLTPRK